MRKFLAAALSIYLITASLSYLEACTGIKLMAKNGSSIHGRTWELGLDLDASVIVVPKEYDFTGTTPHGPGLSYSAKYGAVGMIAFNQPAIIDGINEAGLSVGTFHFPGYAQYAEILPDNQCLALSPVEFPNWILTQFATVEEVRAGLNSVLIAPTIVREWGKEPPHFHYIVFDKKGKSLVIEPIQGQLAVYENKIGILTNAPGFSWHMNYLRNFVHLSSWNTQPLKLNGLDIAPIGQGSEMNLPGDLTPSARFVRAALFSTQIKPMNNTDEAVHQAFHILNQFDIPIGVSRDEKNNGMSDYTAMTSVRDPHSLKYYFKTHVDSTIRMIDLNQFDLNASHIKRVRISETNQPIADISSELE